MKMEISDENLERLEKLGEKLGEYKTLDETLDCVLNHVEQIYIIELGKEGE